MIWYQNFDNRHEFEHQISRPRESLEALLVVKEQDVEHHYFDEVGNTDHGRCPPMAQLDIYK